MADLTWIGSTDGDLGDKANYIVTSTGLTPASNPANGDTLRFTHKALRSGDDGLATGLTGLIIIGTAGFVWNIGSASTPMSGTFASITWGGRGAYAKFSGDCPIVDIQHTGVGVLVQATGVWGATSAVLSYGQWQVEAAAELSGSATIRVVNGYLDAMATATSGKPDIEIGPGGRVRTKRSFGRVENDGRITFQEAAGLDTAEILNNRGTALLQGSGTFPVVNARPGSVTSVKGATAASTVTVLNKWSTLKELSLKSGGVTVTPGTTNEVDSAGSDGAGELFG